MPKAERILLQVRLSLADKQRIKSLASKYGYTLEKAVPEAFAAWAEKMRHQPQVAHRARAAQPAATPLPPAPPPAWLDQAFKLDWTKCPEVELLDDGENRLWMIRASEAPLKATLRAVAEGIPLNEISETLEVEMPRLEKVLEFALARL